MENKSLLTKILAVLGTVLVWIPNLAPILFAILAFQPRRGLRIDYLMPAELFPAGLVGGGLLLWAALRASSRRKLIGWGVGVAVGLLIGGQALAVVTGLASGASEPAAWLQAVILATLGVYSFALMAAGVGGVFLLFDLFRPARPPATGA